MRAALALARRGLGSTWPNPTVGCVLVADGHVIGRGWTQPGGVPHAETVALERAGDQARGATAYISLEPCSHYGKTPPCADALVAAGISRAVLAMQDPNPDIDGRGIDKLKAAGVDVELGLMEAEARKVNAGFSLMVERGRPLVTLKTATTLDGRIAVSSGASQWITGAAARRRAHLLRSQNDAVMVGAGTAVADNPQLTCRLPGLAQRSPVRIVLDSSLRLPLTHHLVAGARARETWLITSGNSEGARKKALRDIGVEVIEVGADEYGHPDLVEAIGLVAQRGITRLLVEGGGRLAAALLRARLVDRLAWFRVAKLIGGDGYPVTQPFGVDKLEDMPVFRSDGTVRLGQDVLETYTIEAYEDV